MSEKYQKVYEFISEKRGALAKQEVALKAKESELNEERRKIYAEFSNTGYEQIAGIDTTAYDKSHKKAADERVELDALKSELTLTMRTLKTGEAPAKDECIRLPRVLALIAEQAQDVFETSDPNIFNKGIQKDLPPDLASLLSEYSDAVKLLKYVDGYGRREITRPQRIGVPDFGEGIHAPTLTTHRWLKKLIDHIQQEQSELSTQLSNNMEEKTALNNRKFYRMHSRAEWLSDIEGVEKQIDDIEKQIKNSIQLEKEMSFVCNLLLMKKMPAKKECMRLGNAISSIEAEAERLRLSETLNLIQTEFLTELDGIFPILDTIHKGR